MYFFIFDKIDFFVKVNRKVGKGFGARMVLVGEGGDGKRYIRVKLVVI